MSITDSSTALNTAYTEQSIVAFTAGTLTNISACVSEIESKIRRGTLSTSTRPTLAQVKGWLVRAKEELAESKGFTWNRKYATCSTVASQYRYSLPPDYNGGMTVVRDTSNDRPIQIISRDDFDNRFPDPSAETNNEPILACVKNMELWLSPPPDGIYTLELEYARSGAETTAEDLDWLPEIERWRCCDYAIGESFLSLQQYEAANMYMSKWTVDVRKSRMSDGRKKWRRTNYRVKTWQETFSDSGNQLD